VVSKEPSYRETSLATGERHAFWKQMVVSRLEVELVVTVELVVDTRSYCFEPSLGSGFALTRSVGRTKRGFVVSLSLEMTEEVEETRASGTNQGVAAATAA